LVIVPRRLSAPRQDGAVVAEPPLAQAGQLLVANRQRLASAGPDLMGRPWAELRRDARAATVALAREYLRRSGEPVPSFPDGSLVMAGHQPELFHPGVWAKNFALHTVAREHEAAALNLVVDNDTAKATALHLPDGHEDDGAQVVSVPFDQWKGEVPYEERRVFDEALFASLPERARPITSRWRFEPMLAGFWAEVLRQAGRTPLLGERFAAARRTFERGWGCHNLEVPLSLICRSEPFAWFVCHLLADLERFHAVYNACVRDYRRLYHIRSRNHPVPELAAQDGWLEVPLWAWHADRPQRARLFARPSASGLELRIGEERGPMLPWPASGDPVAAVAAWQGLDRQGIKVRCRALTNTLYARYFLADLFIHGIGGGKYDELTDEIARRFYGVELPGFLVLSATLLLPFGARPTAAEERRRLSQHLRDLHWNPQRHLDGAAATDPVLRGLTADKDIWIARRPETHAGRRERFHRLHELTARLRCYVADDADALRRELERRDREWRSAEVLRRRDYPFCAYPAAQLYAFCRRFLAGSLATVAT
jgi:hypothetical protein